MPAIIAVIIVIIFVVVKCESAYPTQNYYKKDVTNEEYKRVLEECGSAKNTAIDWELYKNPKNYSSAGHLGEYAKDECFKEKGFIKGENASQATEATEAERVVKELEDDLNDFAIELVGSTKKNIYNPNVKKKRNDHYIITFETSDPSLLKKPSSNALANDAANALWGAKFCTEKLEQIIIKNSLKRVEGRILNAEMFLAICDDTDATTNELLVKDMQDNLKRIQSMIK